MPRMPSTPVPPSARRLRAALNATPARALRRPNPGPALPLRARTAALPGSPGVLDWRLGVRGHRETDLSMYLGAAHRIPSLGGGAADRRPWALLAGLRVEPELQGRGLAGVLLARAVEKARAWGAEGISLHAVADEGGLSQGELVAFYRRHGFDFYDPANADGGFHNHLWMDLRPSPRKPTRPPEAP